MSAKNGSWFFTGSVYVTLSVVLLHSLRGSNGTLCGTAARCGSEGKRWPPLPIFKPPPWPAFSALIPLPLPEHVFRKQRPCPSLIYRFSALRSLIISQKRDLEKDAVVSHSEKTSKPNSQHSLDVLDLSTKLQNPLAGKDKSTLEADAVSFCERHGLMDYGP